MPDSNSRSRKSGSGQGPTLPTTNSRRPVEEAGRRNTLDETKPPREWRSGRQERPGPGSSTHPGRTPQVARRVPSSTPDPPAGSSLADTPTSAGDLRHPAEHERLPSADRLPAPSVEAPAAAPGLPERYGEDRMVILVRDPYWAYVWWELTDARLDGARQELREPGQVVLRFYDVSLIDWDGSNHHETFDIDVTDTAGNWYVELAKPGASFCAELGLRATDGRFVPMVRSNTVTLPRDSLSPVVDEEWMVLDEEYRKLFDLSGGGSIGLGSGEILRALEERLRHELASGGVSSFGVSSLAARRTPS
ncbi:MAG: DUF4912 domain-containing protein [Candidatus Krumholzibacteriia bacterium]